MSQATNVFNLEVYEKKTSCSSVIINRIDWKSFIWLPSDTIIGFYTYVFEEFNVSPYFMSTLFGVSPSSVSRNVSKYEVLKKYVSNYNHMSDAEKIGFTRFANNITLEGIKKRWPSSNVRSWSKRGKRIPKYSDGAYYRIKKLPLNKQEEFFKYALGELNTSIVVLADALGVTNTPLRRYLHANFDIKDYLSKRKVQTLEQHDELINRINALIDEENYEPVCHDDDINSCDMEGEEAVYGPVDYFNGNPKEKWQRFIKLEDNIVINFYKHCSVVYNANMAALAVGFNVSRDTVRKHVIKFESIHPHYIGVLNKYMSDKQREDFDTFMNTMTIDEIVAVFNYPVSDNDKFIEIGKVEDDIDYNEVSEEHVKMYDKETVAMNNQKETHKAKELLNMTTVINNHDMMEGVCAMIKSMSNTPCRITIIFESID